jgi:hypothetical protein
MKMTSKLSMMAVTAALGMAQAGVGFANDQKAYPGSSCDSIDDVQPFLKQGVQTRGMPLRTFQQKIKRRGLTRPPQA